MQFLSKRWRYSISHTTGRSFRTHLVEQRKDLARPIHLQPKSKQPKAGLSVVLFTWPFLQWNSRKWLRNWIQPHLQQKAKMGVGLHTNSLPPQAPIQHDLKMSSNAGNAKTLSRVFFPPSCRVAVVKRQWRSNIHVKSRGTKTQKVAKSKPILALVFLEIDWGTSTSMWNIFWSRIQSR